MVCDDSQGLVKSYQLKLKTSRFAWLAVGEEAKQRPGLQVNVYCSDISLFIQCIIKQLLDSVFVISRIIKVSGGFNQPQPITLTSTLITLDITKTSSNNCLLKHHCISQRLKLMKIYKLKLIKR